MNLGDLDLNLLLAFEALAETGSVTQAARRLGIGQPGMSAALARLRALLGDELFVRAGRTMQPTPLVREIAPGVAAALAQLRRTLEGAGGFDPATARRRFTVGMSDYGAATLLPALAERLHRHAPGIDLRVVAYEKDDIRGMLDGGGLDVVVGVFADPPGRAVATRLWREHFVGIARSGHPALARPMDAASFAGLPQALVTVRRDAVGSLDEALAVLGLRRRVALTLPFALALPRVLRGSDLVAAMPSRIAADLAGQGIATFALPLAVPDWTLTLLWPATARRDPAATWLRAAIAACARLAPNASPPPASVRRGS